MNKDNIKLILNNKEKDLASYFELEKIRNNDRDPRHYAPANKQWKNSVYVYNKSSILNIAAKDQKATALVKSYFNLVLKPVTKTKSKRMRDLLRHSSANQFFTSRPEIKQNNDKAIVTVYTYDREKFSHLKRLYMLNKWLNTDLFGSTRLFNETFKSNSYLINKYNVDHLIENRVFNKHRQIRYRASRNIQRKGSLRYSIKPIFLLNTVKSLLNKKQFFTGLGFNYFLTWILSLFRLQLNIVPEVISVKFDQSETKEVDVVNLVLTKKEQKEQKEQKKKNNKNKNKETKIIFEKKIIMNGTLNMKMLNEINLVLLDYLIINFKNTFNTKHIYILYHLYNIYINKFNYPIVKKHLKKEILIIKCITKLYLNKFKFHTLLPGLKSFLSSIYDKKVQFNLVNLKNLHLNSDLFTQDLSVKLRDRTKNLYRTLAKSFFVKTFKPNNRFLVSESLKHSIVKNIETYFGRYNVINGNVLNVIFKKMFKKNKTSIKKLNGNVINILASLKYKWITGIRLEAAGRLTKRYAAARAVFKYKRKGTLKNLEHLKNVENKLQSPSLFLLRSHVRPNIQYSFVPSKRRIGAFGLKSWISSS